MDASGKIQPNGVEGEVLKGDNVTQSYENNEEANKSSFLMDGLELVTRFFDSDGYLKISGIEFNRGGKNISLEIDNVLMEHESIEQVAFCVKDKMLGETLCQA